MFFLTYIVICLFISRAKVVDLFVRCSNLTKDNNASESDAILGLPAPIEENNAKQIKFGETVRFEEMGPIIINADGTTRRIMNWETLTEHERETTYRLISARNKRRIEDLKKNKIDVVNQVGQNSDRIDHESDTDQTDVS
jgi:hypothetical protein